VDATPNSGRWELAVSYIEESYPGGDVQVDPTWTFQRLADTGGSFAQVAADYPDFPSLLLNDKGPA
jgi:hypothetical protein